MKHLYVTLCIFFIACQQQIPTTTHLKLDLCGESFTKSANNGYTKHYFENTINIKSIGHYKNGIPDGFWKHFYRNGTVKSEGHYRDGQKQGFWKMYYKNSVLQFEGNIENCQPDGHWKFYNQNNKLTKIVTY